MRLAIPCLVYCCMALSLSGCATRKYYSVYVENHLGNDINEVMIQSDDGQLKRSMGVIASQMDKGFGPCDPGAIPDRFTLTWRDIDIQREENITVPDVIRQKIKGKAEDLFFRINDDGVSVYVRISNPRDLSKPTYFPESFGEGE